MRRRDFLGALSGVTVSWPLVARAQQDERIRRIGVLANVAASDVVGQARLATFRQRMHELGWVEGRNVRFDVRWGAGDRQRYRQYARDLVALKPDALLAITSSVIAALQQATSVVPIVFVGVIDPVGSGFVRSLARPAGNLTGFTIFEFAISAKWIELLKEFAPTVRRFAILRDASTITGIGQFAAIQAVQRGDIELSAINVKDFAAIERDVQEFAEEPNGGLVITANPLLANHPERIAALATRHKLPAVYPFRYFVDAGGLASYGPDLVGQMRPAADYMDRILRGERPNSMPVQAPTRYELTINLKAAKAIGLNVPTPLLARADEVID